MGRSAIYSVICVGRYGGHRDLAGTFAPAEPAFRQTLSGRTGNDAAAFLLFVIPIALLVNSLVDNSVPLIKVVTSGNFTPPDLAWLNTVPLIGDKLYTGWHNLLEMGARRL